MVMSAPHPLPKVRERCVLHRGSCVLPAERYRRSRSLPPHHERLRLRLPGQILPTVVSMEGHALRSNF